MVVLPGARLVGFDERFRFDTFVVGITTRDAADAARVVAESPGGEAAPLVIAGPPGTGKSHLLGAIARRARELRPQARIAVIAGADAGDDWSALDGAQLVLVDDARDTRERDRLSAALQAAARDGARVVLTWPDTAVAFDATSGAVAALVRGARVVHLGAPDLEARREIVRRATQARGLRLASAVVSAIADRPVADVRDLLGAVSRVGAAGGLHAADPMASAAGPALAPGADLDFASFLDEVAREVAAHAEPWRLQLGEAATRARAEGFAVDVLDRALRLSVPPDVDALLATFTAAVDRLRALAAEAASLGVDAADHPALRDPTRLVEAEGLVAEVRAARPAPNAAPGVRGASSPIDAETWVLDWPNVADLLVEQWS